MTKVNKLLNRNFVKEIDEIHNFVNTSCIKCCQ